MIDGLAAAVAAFAAGATLRADMRGGATRWVPDSYDYAIRMPRLRGVPLLEAQERAHVFMVTAPHTAGLVRFAAAYSRRAAVVASVRAARRLPGAGCAVVSAPRCSSP